MRAAPYRAGNIEQQNRDYRYLKERVQRSPVKLIFWCDMAESADERYAHKQDKKDCPQAKHGMKEPA